MSLGQVSQDTCCVSSVACHMSIMPTVTAMDPHPANSPTMHSRMVCEIFFVVEQNFYHFWAKISNVETNVISTLFLKESFCFKSFWPRTLDHTLSIWLRIEFTSSVFFWKHQCANCCVKNLQMITKKIFSMISEKN